MLLGHMYCCQLLSGQLCSLCCQLERCCCSTLAAPLQVPGNTHRGSASCGLLASLQQQCNEQAGYTAVNRKQLAAPHSLLLLQPAVHTVDVPVAASCTMQVCTASTAWVLLKHRLMRANVSPAIAANNCGSTGSGSRVCAAMPQPQLADFVHQPAQTTLLLFRLLQVKRMMQAISQNTSYCPE